MRALRRRELALRCASLLLLVSGCSYPEFDFVPSDAAPTSADSTVADVAPGPDAIGEDTTDAPMDVGADDEPPDVGTDSEGDAGADTTIATDARPETTADIGPDTRDASADTRDASADTRPPAMDAGDAAPRGCALTHLFCADFDTATLPESGWSGKFSAGSGMLALDTATSTSAPKSLLATVGAGTTTSSAMLSRNILTVPLGATIRVEADVMVDSLGYTSMYDLILFKVQRSTAGDGVSLSAGPTGLKLAVQAAAGSDAWPITGIVAGKWFHVRIDAVLHSTAGEARLYLDGATTPQITKTGIPTADVDDTAGRQLVVGVFGFMASSPYRVHYDDVSLDLP